MLAVSSDDGKLLTVLAQCVELVCESCLELLTSDVGKLGFSDEGFRFRTDEFLFKDNDTGGVGLLVFELSDLIGNFLLAVTAGLDGGLNIANALDGDAILVVAIDELVFELADFVDEDTKFVCDVGDIIIAGFTPDGQLLLGSRQ